MFGAETITMTLSLRERYLMAQALILAIETLAEEDERRREWSNMQDMGALLKSDALAPFAFAVLASLQAMGKTAYAREWSNMMAATTAGGAIEDEAADLPF